MPRRILILFSDTGGGHRSAGEAIAEALQQQHGTAAQVSLVDVFQQYSPYPFNRFPAWYPLMIRHGLKPWEYGFKLTDRPGRTRGLYYLFWPYLRRAFRRLVRDHPSDVVVSVHPLLIIGPLRALGRQRPPFVTVVTDLVSTHAAWYYNKVDLCVVPTPQAEARARQNGMPADRLRMIGLPVAARFCTPVGDRDALRRQLGWTGDHPVILLVGGGDGMGPLGEIARAVAASRLPLELAVVCGRNAQLQAELAAHTWPVPAHIYGFVREMPDLMRAADVLVTKAGPGTICEGLIAGLPLILYGRLPGQEEGNVDYVTEEGAGVYAPGAERVVQALQTWVGPQAEPGNMARVAERARRLGRPRAADEIAAVIWDACG